MFLRLALLAGLSIVISSCTKKMNGQESVSPLSSKLESAPTPEDIENQERLVTLCSDLNKKFQKLGWKSLKCEPQDFKVGGRSVEGRPLIYAEFGDTTSPHPKTTLLTCGVHADELTSIYLCFRALHVDFVRQLKEKKVVIAPLVNPDGFFKAKPTRTNARGVDLNRNFLTRDWDEKAHREWQRQYRSDKRKFPGEKPNSEPETMFQIDLIRNHKPDKILSAHAPLKLIDYDGPADQAHFGLERRENRARYLAMNISKNSRFPLVDYRFFPGSLGNFAGREMEIPTYTLELPTSDAAKGEHLWTRFEYALQKAFNFDVSDQGPESISSREED